MTPPTILTILVDDIVLRVCTLDDPPLDLTLRTFVGPKTSVLTLDQPTGTRHQFALNFEQEAFDLRMRLHESFALELDGTCHHQGIRFQPIILDVSRVAAPETRGRGLIARGFHLPGEVTPSDVSEACICDDCGGSFRLHAFHAGFSDIAYFYSASGKFTLVVNGTEPGAPVPLSDPDPVALAALEARLPPAPDGSRFSYLNALRCPHCKVPYIDFARHPEMRPKEYYGHTFFGHRAIEFR
jgi:hypothetical protein